jgi:hypothetical protein
MLTPIVLKPLPASSAVSVRQAASLTARVNDVGLEIAKDEALDAILAVSPDDEASERQRLRLLYRQVYSADELRGLIERTFRKFGLE